MNPYKVIAVLSIIINFLILCALEGDAISILTAVLLIVPMEGLMIWSLDKSGWINTEAVEADKQAMINALKSLRGGKNDC